MSFRRKLLLKIGGFDCNFIGNFYRDDTDVSLAIRRLGCNIIYTPDAVVFHKNIGRVRIDAKWAYFYFRNNAYFFAKNLRGKLILFPYFIVFQIIPSRKNAKQTVIRAEIGFSLLLSMLKGIIRGLVEGMVVAR